MPDEGGRAVGARMFQITPFGRGRRLVPGVGRACSLYRYEAMSACRPSRSAMPVRAGQRPQLQR